MTPIKENLLKYDDLKRKISKRYKDLSVFDVGTHVNLIIDGIRCFVYSLIYKGIPIENAYEQFKIEIMCKINDFFLTLKKGNIKNKEKEQGLKQWM